MLINMFLHLVTGERTGPDRADSLVGRAKDVLAALRNRRAVMRLTDLDDRALKDIGLLRADVEGALLEPLHKDPSKVLSVRRPEPRPRPRPTGVNEPPSRRGTPAASDARSERSRHWLAGMAHETAAPAPSGQPRPGGAPQN